MPYQWWGFRPAQMIGLIDRHLGAASVEEVGRMDRGKYATVIVFEIFKLWQASGRRQNTRFWAGSESRS